MVRTLILYFIVLVALRIMGKSELSEMEPFQLVVLIMIAELAAMPMEDPGLSLFNGVSAVVILMFLQILISFISCRSERFRIFFNGKSKALIQKGVLDEKALRDLRISISDLLEQLRIKDYPSISDVDFAILESNGELSVIPKSHKKPLVREDLNINKLDEDMPIPLIVNGKLYDNSLVYLNMTEAQFAERLKDKGVDDYGEILLCYSDETHDLIVYKKGDRE